MIQAKSFVETAKAAGFSLYTGVPCSYVKPFINYVIDAPDLAYIGAANEGDAIAIATPGDTIRLTTTPIERTLPLRIDKTLVVEGGWNEAFSARTPQTPTAIDTRGAGPVIFLDQPQATVVLDALHLRNGAGTLCAPPELGNVLAGGGLLCWGARAVLRDCILESNVAGTAAIGRVMSARSLTTNCTLALSCAKRALIVIDRLVVAPDQIQATCSTGGAASVDCG